jgi:phospholipase/carboxylesterase
LVLLHGAGGNEADLMPIARRIAPRATLLGVRGRATEEGTNRWFRRFDATTFDQADIRTEADAFAAFVEGAVTGYGLDPDRLAFLGYSNGANLLAAVIQLHPGVVRRAILLRGIWASENAEAGKLSGTRVLMLNGRDDPLIRKASTLAVHLMEGGAKVEVRTLSAGHDLSGADVTEAAQWLRQNLPGEATVQPTDTSG